MAIQQKLADDNPAVTDFRNRQAQGHNDLGILLSDTGKPAEAEAEYREAPGIRQKLADDYPAITEFRSRLAASHHNLGHPAGGDGQAVGGGGRVSPGHGDSIEKLADDDPAVTAFRANWRTPLQPRRPAARRRNRLSEAEAEYPRGGGTLTEAGHG